MTTQVILVLVLLLGVLGGFTARNISYQVNDDAVNPDDFRGIIMYVWNEETGALERSTGAFSFGYNNGSDGCQCAVIEDTNNFERKINGVPNGRIVGLAFRARLTLKPEVNYAKFYNSLESFAFGKVSGTSNVRNMAGDDAYVIITKKDDKKYVYKITDLFCEGEYNSTKEWLMKLGGNQQEKMAEIYHHDNGIIFTVGSHVNTKAFVNSFTYARSEEDQELLMNADFEDPSFSGSWFCSGCTLTSYSNDTYHGRRSVLVTDRKHPYSAPQQRVDVTPGYNYVFKTYFKLLNLPTGVNYTTLKLTANIKLNGSSKYLRLGIMPLQQVKFGWTEFSGDFLAPAGATTAQIYINIEHSSVNFIQDLASLKKIKPNLFWMQHAKSRINNTRKAPISFRLEGEGIQGYEVEIMQQRSAYPFGTAIKLDKFNVPEYQFFTDFVLKHFNWAVIANKLKWYGIERIQDQSDYTSVLAALDVLEANGIKSRGHNMFWGVEKFVNSWLYGMSPSELVAELQGHVTEVIKNTKGRLLHWDVNNENLHGDWYERNTTDPDITSKMFQWIHAQEPDTQLFLNDYSAIPQPSITTALKNQALRFRRNNVPIHGIGVQSHFYTTDIDMDVIKYRIDKLAEAGLDIWATELTVDEADDVKKADALGKLLTMYFSHPSVGGVILWHFWNESLWHPNENLFDGPNIKPNAAGQRFMNLVHGEWKSSVTQRMVAGTTYNVTAFMGDYVMNVRRNDQVVQQRNFTLDSSGNDVTIYADENLSETNVVIGQWYSYGGQCISSASTRVTMVTRSVVMFVCVFFISVSVSVGG